MRLKHFLFVSFLAYLHLQEVHSAKILFYMAFSSHSHRVAVQPLADKLADRGHEVTFLSPIKPEKPNPLIKEFCPKELKEANENIGDKGARKSVHGRLRDRHYDPYFHGNFLWDTAYKIIEAGARSPGFAGWVNKSSFDLVFIDHPVKEFGFALASRFKAKTITFSPFSLSLMSDVDIFGLPDESSWLMDWTMGSKWWFIPDHFVYAYNSISWYFSFTGYQLPRLDKLAAETLGPGLPPIKDLIRNTSLVFMNDYFFVALPRSFPPYFINVGGIHAQPAEGNLSQELQDFIDKSQNGFVYISFGSIIKITALPLETQQILFDAVRRFEQIQFLLKWEGAIPRNLPPNVLAMNWFPQRNVLAHPKCKGFVTQGGIISMQQALYHKVPVIVIPVWFDQPFNARVAARHGVGIHLELSEITIETFSQSLRQILTNASYSNRVKEAGEIFMDRPMTALDTAVWWTEYALRYDTSCMKPPGLYQYWWQRRLLDFWIIVSSIILAFATLLVIVLRWLLAFVLSSEVTTKLKTA